MSRRRGEFEHRTSIFEGAFRAWSYLGGLDPLELEAKSLAELDPLNANAEERSKSDPRLAAAEYKKQQSDNAKGGEGERRIYPYEPLPRSGLAHPFVQAILSPWLGPEAEQNAIQLGLTTLRTWWQHRRKGESGSAIQALGTEKMRGVVEGYTRHFFSLAYCLVTNDGEQPPRSLYGKMKELEKVRQKKHKRKAREEEAGKLAALALNAGIAHGLQTSTSSAVGGAASTSSSAAAAGLSAAAAGSSASATAPDDSDDEKELSTSNSFNASSDGLLVLEHFARKHQSNRPPSPQTNPNLQAAINLKGKCVPGKLDLQQLALQMQAHGTQSMHMAGVYSGVVTPEVSASAAHLAISNNNNTTTNNTNIPTTAEEPDRTMPVIFVSPQTAQIAMSVDGITCAHCVKIVETVLKGCSGNKSPIDGLLDAAADHELCSIIIKIDRPANACRIARESARNLAMVGYTAKVMELSVDPTKLKLDLGMIYSAFEVVANTDPTEVFDWTLPCTCPDNGVLRKDCRRHLQMNEHIFQAFRDREKKVLQYVLGTSASSLGADCSCGDPSKCHCNKPRLMKKQRSKRLDPMMNMTSEEINKHLTAAAFGAVGKTNEQEHFGRAMSGLSALSIDWDNIDDFDVNVDHSAHITNSEFKQRYQQQQLLAQANSIRPQYALEEEDDMFSAGIMAGCAMARGGQCSCGPTCACVGCPIHDTAAAAMAQQQHHQQQQQNFLSTDFSAFLGNPAMMAAAINQHRLYASSSSKRGSLNSLNHV